MFNRQHFLIGDRVGFTLVEIQMLSNFLAISLNFVSYSSSHIQTGDTNALIFVNLRK
jgi:hypothetical protein